jgi:RNA polymerase sigma-70 factor (ECF subfamily)
VRRAYEIELKPLSILLRETQKELLVKNDLNITDRRKADAEIVRRALDGNEDAFADLFNAHKTKVYSLCLRMTSNTAEAEDLTQDAFLQVFRKLGTFRGDSALSTWLYRVAVNTVLMHFRKKGLRQVSLEEPASREAGAPKREHGKADERLSTSVDRIALTRAMKELPAGYRTIFLLHEVKGYEHHEIASLLRCSVGNSKSQLHKAKVRMRELLGMQNGQDRDRAARQRSLAESRLHAEAPLVDAVIAEASETWGSTEQAVA